MTEVSDLLAALPLDSLACMGRRLNEQNIAYWRDKTCTHCNKRGHGAHVCPVPKCRFCGRNGIHKTAVACEAARGAIAILALQHINH